MNILLYDFLNSYIQQDLIFFLEKAGHKCNSISCKKPEDVYNDEGFMSRMRRDLEQGSYDLVLTTNFWPVISRVCHEKDMPYVSWFFDSPPNLPTADYMEYSCNRIYFFARADYEAYKAKGLDNVFYLPLAVNVPRLKSIKVDQGRYGSEISFVGKLYQSMLPAMKSHMTDYQKGYIDGVVKMQMELYGGFIIDDVITEEFAQSVRERYLSLSDKALMIKRKELSWAVASYVTNLERMTLLRILSKRHQVKLYTYELSDEEKRLIPEVEFCGPVDYMTQMPQVFAASKINLCPVLKANKSGIPLRALDIMGCGGFLLSSFQPELYEYFEDGTECVMYTSLQDAVEKAAFYLQNEELRKQVAAAGVARIERDFSYEDRIEKLLGEFA